MSIVCQRCGNGPAVLIERTHPVWKHRGQPIVQKAIVCGGCILDQYIEWTEGETDGESE